MFRIRTVFVLSLLALFLSQVALAGPLHDEREKHLDDVRQLTFGGENAEAYWSPDGKQLSFQSTRPPYGCDQIFRMDPWTKADPSLVSTGTGRTTCAHFTGDGNRVIYASTHHADPGCPPVPDHSQGYVWPLYSEYELFSAKPDGSDLQRMTENDYYDAEATVCAANGAIVFTSTRTGDLELFTMAADGSDLKQITDTPGYDGGAFFNSDCTKVVWRASRPAGEDLADYRRLLSQGLVRPGLLEIFVANADGSEVQQVTSLGAATFAPFFSPDSQRILFSSNHGSESGREFDIWSIGVDGKGLERISYTEGFDGFPMFSPDGKTLVFSSNRNQGKPGETDVYIARWID